MTISRAVVEDLYPLYAAGEASADSRALVEEYWARNPGAAAAMNAPVRLPSIEPPPDLESHALKRTARLLDERSLMGAAALTLSYAPVALGFVEQGRLHLLYQDFPRFSVFLYAAAIALWVRFFFACRRVQVAGLRPRRNWTARMVWFVCGWAIGVAACAPIQTWTGWRAAINVVPWITFSIAVFAGEWLDQVPKIDELTRPTTIFGPHDDDGGN